MNRSINQVTKHAEMPQTVHIDKGVDVPVVKQRQVPQIQTPRMTVEVPTVQFTDRVMNVPVIMQITLVTKPVKIPQIQHTSKVVDVPVVKQRQVPQIQTPRMTVEVPTVQFTDRVMEAPVVMQMRHPLHSFRRKLWR